MFCEYSNTVLPDDFETLSEDSLKSHLSNAESISWSFVVDGDYYPIVGRIVEFSFAPVLIGQYAVQYVGILLSLVLFNVVLPLNVLQAITRIARW